MKALKRIWLTIRAPIILIATGVLVTPSVAFNVNLPPNGVVISVSPIPLMAINIAALAVYWSKLPIIFSQERRFWTFVLIIFFIVLLFDLSSSRYDPLIILGEADRHPEREWPYFLEILLTAISGIRLSYLCAPGRAAPDHTSPASATTNVMALRADPALTFETNFKGHCNAAFDRVAQAQVLVREAQTPPDLAEASAAKLSKEIETVYSEMSEIFGTRKPDDTDAAEARTVRLASIDARISALNTDHDAQQELIKTMRGATDVGSLKRARSQLAEARLKGPAIRTEGRERNALLASGITRSGIIFVLLFLATALLNLYRYAIRLSAFHRSRACTLVLTGGDLDQLKRATAALAPDNVPLGKEVNALIDEATKIIPPMKSVR